MVGCWLRVARPLRAFQIAEFGAPQQYLSQILGTNASHQYLIQYKAHYFTPIPIPGPIPGPTQDPTQDPIQIHSRGLAPMSVYGKSVTVSPKPRGL